MEDKKNHYNMKDMVLRQTNLNPLSTMYGRELVTTVDQYSNCSVQIVPHDFKIKVQVANDGSEFYQVDEDSPEQQADGCHVDSFSPTELIKYQDIPNDVDCRSVVKKEKFMETDN